ncbi:Lrp/AsnC family transcriptional regulator [Kordiimonas sp.]|uniref:Lrp/AsnC family transcriptional regulator n=1 Tax=Kordiimonas sp. TaxID=1970157 RepID=UPI003A933613
MTRYNNPLNLDRLDYKIITALLKQGRITKVQLSEEVGLSASPCWERMKRLEKEKVIRGYHADIDLSKLVNISFFRVEVKLENYSMHATHRFEDMIKRMPEVVECEAVLGSQDYMVKIAAVSVEKYQEIIERMMNQKDVTFDYRTYPVTKSVKTMNDVSIQSVIAVANEE